MRGNTQGSHCGGKSNFKRQPACLNCPPHSYFGGCQGTHIPSRCGWDAAGHTITHIAPGGFHTPIYYPIPSMRAGQCTTPFTWFSSMAMLLSCPKGPLHVLFPYQIWSETKTRENSVTRSLSMKPSHSYTNAVTSSFRYNLCHPQPNMAMHCFAKIAMSGSSTDSSCYWCPINSSLPDSVHYKDTWSLAINFFLNFFHLCDLMEIIMDVFHLCDRYMHTTHDLTRILLEAIRLLPLNRG